MSVCTARHGLVVPARVSEESAAFTLVTVTVRSEVMSYGERHRRYPSSSRPLQWPADDLEHQFALGPVLSRLLRSIGPNLGANMIILLRIAVRVVQEILQGVRSAQSVNQRENATPV